MSRSTRTLAPLGAMLGLAACTTGGAGPAPAPVVASPGESVAAGRPAAAAATITGSDLYARVSFLASDALRGRDTPSPGLDAAAAYLVSEYRRLGLEPAGENGTFYQRYPLPLLALDTATVHLGIVVRGENRMLAYGTDFYAHAAAGGADPAMGHAVPVYVGVLPEQGLPAGQYRGAAPVVLVPGEYGRTWRREVNRARQAAQQAGASALMVVTAPEFSAASFRAQAVAARRPVRRVVAEGEIPVFYLAHRAAQGLAARAGQRLDALPRTAATPVPLTGMEAHFAANARVLDPATAPNVVAVLRGSDPQLRDEYVVLSSHMDHVGVGRPVNGDSIYNGADDDASGTAGILEVAEALVSLPQRPRRSLVFLHVSGEEKGLLGSRWYSDHPTVPLQQIVANVNVDMIGRNHPDSVVVIGKNFSSLGTTADAVQAQHPELGLTLSDDIWPEEQFFFRSDHFNFARKEIPSIFFFSGVHADYHQPSDEVDRLDVDKAARVSRIIFYTVQEIANAPTRPRWDPAGLEQIRALTR